MAISDLQAAPVAAPAGTPPAGAPSDGDKPFALFGEDGFTFADFLDIVNPLQHIPVIGTLYRRITGDVLDPGARLAGGALFGGAIGGAVAIVNAALEDATGRDAGEHVLAFFEGDGQPTPDIALAQAVAAPVGVPDLALLGPLPAAARPAAAEPPAPIDLAALAPLPSVAPGIETAAVPVAPTTPAGALPPGAVAGEGGWFSQTMLDALEKYQEAARLALRDETAGPVAN